MWQSPAWWPPGFRLSKLAEFTPFLDRLLGEHASPIQYALAALGHCLIYRRNCHLSPEIWACEKVNFYWALSGLFFTICGLKFTKLGTHVLSICCFWKTVQTRLNLNNCILHNTVHFLPLLQNIMECIQVSLSKTGIQPRLLKAMMLSVTS